jgi:hypothetical protein
LALSLGVDPEKLEQKIQWSKAELKGAEGLPGFDEFQKIDEHFRKWWSRPTTVDTPGEIFARILSIDGIRAEVQLDTKAIARLIQ